MPTEAGRQARKYGRIHSVTTEQATIDREKLIALREAKGWSIKRLADTAEVDYSSYWRLEKGRAFNPRHETVARLARALGVSTEDLSRSAD